MPPPPSRSMEPTPSSRPHPPVNRYGPPQHVVPPPVNASVALRPHRSRWRGWGDTCRNASRHHACVCVRKHANMRRVEISGCAWWGLHRRSSRFPFFTGPCHFYLRSLSMRLLSSDFTTMPENRGCILCLIVGSLPTQVVGRKIANAPAPTPSQRGGHIMGVRFCQSGM